MPLTRPASQTRTEKTAGRDLRIGDMLDLWLGLSRIVAMRPYDGPLKALWPEGAFIADFDNGHGMTISNNDFLPVVRV